MQTALHLLMVAEGMATQQVLHPSMAVAGARRQLRIEMLQQLPSKLANVLERLMNRQPPCIMELGSVLGDWALRHQELSR